MPQSAPFSGSLFFLESVTQLGSATIRVTFSSDPLASSPSGLHDSLNVSNYTITGPAINSVVLAHVVPDNPQSIDLELSEQLTIGTWTLTVVNVQTATGTNLTAPTSLSFSVSTANAIPSLSQGAQDDTSEAFLRKMLSPALKGKGWDALIAAFAIGDTHNKNLAESAFDQLFKTSASGVYLDRLSANDGISRPSDIGISDDVFRKLSIKVTARKQIIQVLLDCLEAYYGSSSTRANSTASIFEPYALTDGDNLLIQIDNKDVVNVQFSSSNFTQIGLASAIEVASVITNTFRNLGLDAYADSYLDPSLNKSFVRIFSGSLGLNGVVTIRGGSSQNIFRFPTPVHVSSATGPQAGTQFTITPGTGINGIPSGRVRFTYSGGADPQLSLVHDSDYVLIFGTVFASNFRNTYSIITATTTYFDIVDSSLAWPANVTLGTAYDLRFYRATSSTLMSSTYWSTATQGNPNQLDIILPATTQAVGRSQNTGAYLHAGTTLTLTTLVRNSSGIVTGTTATNHGLTAGNWIFIDNARPSVTSLTAWANADLTVASSGDGYATLCKLPNGKVLQRATSNTNSNLFDPSTNTWTAAAATNRAQMGHTLTLLNNGKVLSAGGGTSQICELYDYNTNTWTDTGTTSGAHQFHSAHLLYDGKVLIVGGGSGAEIYDPVTGLWSTPAQPVHAYSYHSGVTLHDGRIMIAGGLGVTGFCEIYNPINNTWVSGANCTARYQGRMVVLNNGTSGNVLFIGGVVGGGAATTNIVESFNPATLTWTTVASLNMARAEHVASIMSNGRIMVNGGYNNIGAPVPSTNTEIYDPINNSWTTVSTSSLGRIGGSSILLDDKRLLVAGGGGPPAEAYNYTGSPINAGRINGLFKVLTTPLSTSFTFATPEAPYATTFASNEATFTTYLTAQNGIAGPFIYDTQSGAGITSIASTITDTLTQGLNYSVVNVANASQFPDSEGWLMFGFGTSSEVYPVKYFGRISSTALLISASYTFPKTLASGTTVTLLSDRGVFVPSTPESVGSFYITAASAGRIAASSTIDSIVAAGLYVNKIVVYPGDVGLGNAGYPVSANNKLSDKLIVWGGDDIDIEVANARQV